jgi:hypothetical protein
LLLLIVFRGIIAHFPETNPTNVAYNGLSSIQNPCINQEEFCMKLFYLFVFAAAFMALPLQAQQEGFAGRLCRKTHHFQSQHADR